MNTIKCNICHGYPITSRVHAAEQNEAIYLYGTLPCYKDGNKVYLTECCLENYLIGGDNNYCIQHDQKQELFEAYKGATYKTLLLDSNQYTAQCFAI